MRESEEAELEDVRRVEAVDTEDRSGRSHGGARGHETDELRAGDLGAARPCLSLDALDDQVERSRLVILNVHAHLRTTDARECETEGADAWKTTAGLANDVGDLPRDLGVVRGEVDVERNQRPPRSNHDAAGTFVESRRTKIRPQLPRIEPPLKLGWTSTSEERGAAPRCRLAVEKNGQLELRADPIGEAQRARACPLPIGRVERDHRNDVRCSDPRVHAFVPP